ncbi:MAG: hypothetical protein IT535_07420 [Bauldia sp.]|nr:hypothetical protein [Bauldia sp.]
MLDENETTQGAPRGRASSDEAYVLDLCDEILEEKSVRQKRFPFLLGDPGRGGRAVSLPVDAYYPGRSLVIEYRERQHGEPVPHFDKPWQTTVSGVSRGQQRRLYDDRRRATLPANGLALIEIEASELRSNARGRLLRDRQQDLIRLRAKLSAAGLLRHDGGQQPDGVASQANRPPDDHEPSRS